MRGINRIVIVGRLGKDPEAREGKSGPWCTLSVATNRARKDGDSWVEETDWHDVRAFGDEATFCLRRLCRGSVVAIDGSLVYDAWVDDQGKKRRSPRIVATRVQALSGLKLVESASTETEAVADATVEVPAG